MQGFTEISLSQVRPDIPRGRRISLGIKGARALETGECAMRRVQRVASPRCAVQNKIPHATESAMPTGAIPARLVAYPTGENCCAPEVLGSYGRPMLGNSHCFLPVGETRCILLAKVVAWTAKAATAASAEPAPCAADGLFAVSLENLPRHSAISSSPILH